ncbi:MAG: hypothetical protein DDT33_00507 [Firmicutes bacterium]|nr:hypothetical protein [Bacillota bacterium]
MCTFSTLPHALSFGAKKRRTQNYVTLSEATMTQMSRVLYVTSYEYADLHQLSTIWLDLADDLTEYKKEFIGTSYKEYENKKLRSKLALDIVNAVRERNQKMAKEIEAFFIDMEEVFDESFRILKPGSRCCYVIGDTRLKGVDVLNAEVFAESLQYSGFILDRIIKREIPSKILPQKRDETPMGGCPPTNHENGCRLHRASRLVILRLGAKKVTIEPVLQTA